MDFVGSREIFKDDPLIKRYNDEGTDISINSIDYNSQAKLIIAGCDSRNLLWTPE